MGLQILTNTAASKASLALSENSSKLRKSFERLSSGKRLTSPVQDPGSLAVSMKLGAAINRITGAQTNVQNATSFLEVQDGMLDTVGKIIDRMSELKGLASQDPMKNARDRASYDNEFKDLQVQLYDIAQMKFNGVSIFAMTSTNNVGADSGIQAVFGADNQDSSMDNTLTVYTSTEGQAGTKVSVHRALLLSALTLKTNDLRGEAKSSSGYGYTYTDGVTGMANANEQIETTKFTMTFASKEVGDAISLAAISVGVINQALENVAYLRAQNGGVQSRLAFNSQSLAMQKTNMSAALGRIVDADIAEETTNLAKYQVLSQAAASMLAQANSTTDIALMLIR
jgi:flagellin